MDREYCLKRYEEELEAASNADCEASRSAHESLARAFEEAAGCFGRPVSVVSNPPNLVSSSGDQTREARAG